MRKDLLNKFIFWGVVFIPLFAFATDWHIMTVDTLYSGVYGTSIALDSLDIPHIAYCRYYGPGLMYAYLNPDDSTWIIESVFDSAEVKCDIKDSRIAGTQPSLVFDSKGYPHISFWWGDLGYAWKDSLGWHTTHPNPGPWMRGTSLVLDQNDYPHIGYSVDISNEEALVLHTYWDEHGWHTETVDTIFTAWLGNVSLAVDRNYNIHIAYGMLRREHYFHGLPDIGICYGIRNETGEWEIDTIIDNADTLIEYEGLPSLTLGSLGRPCISYQAGAIIDTNITRLKYSVKVGNEWQIEWVDVSNGNVGALNFLALDACDNPHISYRGDGWLKHAIKKDGIWYTERIDSAWAASIEATYTGIAVDRDEYAHISYNTQIIVDSDLIINTRYATGLPEAGVEVMNEEEQLYDSNCLKIYTNMAQREIIIEYFLKKRSMVTVEIYSIDGREVDKLMDRSYGYGKHRIYWKTNNVANSIYFCTLKIDNKFVAVEKFIIIK
ncbi:hypothetical protein KAX35_07960 [candidate division WOR-3 bacterium]|nr:hypothetical protein [candidate division WOR-3 bacterium]